jgi:flagellar motor switch protein FliM
MKVERHNFAKLGKLAGDLEQCLTTWLEAAAALASKNWIKVLPFEFKLTCGPLETARPASALAQLPDPAVAYKVALPLATSTLLAVPRPVVLAVVAGLLGDAGGALPADRELTAVEDSLWQYLLQDFLLPALKETWQGTTPIALDLEQREPHPQWSRAFVGGGNLVACTLAAQGPFGTQPCRWLAPIKGLLGLLGLTVRQPGEPAAEPAGPSPHLAALVRELPVEIAVELGKADLSLLQLARLGVGDMVVLNQRVTEPLVASVGGGQMLRGWAGRVGNWKAFQIESLTVAN